MRFVLLTDNDEGATLVACPNNATASEVGSAAVYSDGGVSAWLVPEFAVIDHEKVARVLRKGGDLRTIFEKGVTTKPVTTEVGE